ncbi:hypothetical protein R1flu_024791 [Riccia fluitans]|uniref:Fe2OG dioxygenase domain-containing protein n=1 Tax=Riccia fluitans TaxID=41844 RepID=A0ABD1XVW9_9MARC
MSTMSARILTPMMTMIDRDRWPEHEQDAGSYSDFDQKDEEELVTEGPIFHLRQLMASTPERFTNDYTFLSTHSPACEAWPGHQRRRPHCLTAGPSESELTNSLWPTGLAELIKEISARLGYDGIALDVRPYKLLLYGPGGHFVKHRDTEKEDRIFATSVIQLPSLHRGGELVVYKVDVNNPVTYYFGQKTGKAPYACHYAVNYADAEHAVQQITEGYRIAIVYSI